MLDISSTLIDGVKDFVRNGGDINTATPADCFEHISDDLHNHVVGLERKNTGGGGEAVRNIRYIFADDRHMLAPIANETPRVDGWLTGESDNSILFTKQSARGTDRAASYDNLDALSLKISRALRDEDAILVIHAEKENGIGDKYNAIAPKHDMDLVFMPRTFTADTVTIEGVQHLKPKASWVKAHEKHEEIKIGGHIVAWVETVREGFRRYYLNVSGPFNIKGQLDTCDMEVADHFADIIARCISMEFAEREDPEFSKEDIAAYRTAASVLDIIRATSKDHAETEERIAKSVDDARRHIDSAMNTIANMTKRINEESRKLDDIRSGNMDTLVESTVSIINEMNRIANDAPVKSCDLLRTPDGIAYFDIKLHPVIMDTEEWGLNRRTDGAESSLIILDKMHLHLNLVTGGHTDTVIKWQRHSGYHSGERRCHPHSYENGGACWGDAAGEISSAIGDGRWHDMMQWVYAWSGGFRTHDPITFPERFPAAPEGSTVGWVIPE